MTFTDFLSALEARVGLSRRQIEKRAELAPGALFAQLKRGGWPPVDRLQKIASGCGVTLHLALDGASVAVRLEGGDTCEAGHTVDADGTSRAVVSEVSP